MTAHHHPLQAFALMHPHALEWALLIAGALAGMLLWARNA